MAMYKLRKKLVHHHHHVVQVRESTNAPKCRTQRTQDSASWEEWGIVMLTCSQLKSSASAFHSPLLPKNEDECQDADPSIRLRICEAWILEVHYPCSQRFTCTIYQHQYLPRKSSGLSIKSRLYKFLRLPHIHQMLELFLRPLPVENGQPFWVWGSRLIGFLSTNPICLCTRISEM
uniref:HDC01525 n=1 Tax=Drosophila melanogaster TaxID=7227 RepID=Q6IHR3_DROME|nr:TPA_inf: HDC01525 [Drosophila melanogaster]